MSLLADSLTVTVPERFASSRFESRSTEPEVFTFERFPVRAAAVRSFVPVRPKKRCTRVMYPAKVRMHLPPPERSPAKRSLVLLLLVLLWQVYIEEPDTDHRGPDTHHRGPDTGFHCPAPGYWSPADRCPAALPPGPHTAPDRLVLRDSSVPSPVTEQSAGKSYMVALLVYHRLGSDN